MNEITTTTSAQGFGLVPQSISEAMSLSKMLAESELVPKDFHRKPANVLVAMQWGAEVGLKPLQALQNIAVINGRPSLWGDALIALVRGSGTVEYIVEEEKNGTAICRVKRKGEPEQIRTFSAEDAKAAGLSGKSGPWAQYPKRMRQMRARAFALRDVWADVLKGLPIAEEVQDMPAPIVRDMGQVEQVQPDDPDIPETLRTKAEDASLDGVAAYQAFFGSLTREERKLLAGAHPALKAAAEEVDKERAAALKDDPFVAALDDETEPAA